MGRSAGGGGGRGFGGGFSGGGRRSGGFSGGFRSGGRSFGGGMRGAGRGFMPPPPRYHGGGGSFWPFMAGMSLGRATSSRSRTADSASGTGASAGAAGTGCASSGCAGLIFVFAALVVLALIFSLLSSSCSGVASVAASTVEREPLPAGAVVETAYYTDEDGDWIHDPRELEAGMRSFFEQTGVQPYLYILPNGSETDVNALSERADALYDQLFEDEGHFLLVFCDNGYGSFSCGYTVGSQAKTIMDTEAVGILQDYLDRYYQDLSLSEEEIFSRTFADTAERIMSVTPSPLLPVVICVVVIVVALVIVVIVKQRAESRRRDQEHMEEVLNTPLESFGDQKLEDLEQKYRAASTDDEGGHAV